MIKKALITGVTGQDGSYLAEFLLEKGYEVHGIIRRSSSFNTGRIDHIINDKKYKDSFFFHHGDVTDASNLNRILETIEPNEIYNLAAQSHVNVSFEIPDYTTQVDALGTLRFLDAIRETQIDTRFYQASTSELFGNVQEIPQTEKTPLHPRSPYAIAKLYSISTVYRRGSAAKVMVLRRQIESHHVLGRVYMHFYHSKRVSIAPGHFEQAYYSIYTIEILQ